MRADGAHMKAAVNVSPGARYSIHEMRSPDGTRVREFVSPAGHVFGVSWQGPHIPDLRQLLGEHFDEYMQEAERPGRAHRGVLHIETQDLVFESGGHMRFFSGRAYLRSELPDGADADAIQ